ncbi:hypothetical protein ACWDAO_12155 [Streptomyces sp. NPDC001212]|uniref:hypothetical protein n=1 Tax=unclassified Streptomyces TaxID=2593676 RepID=UPI001CD3B9EC|nr:MULTISPECIES: hypothetical protein [unclassified Streptomyces]
MHRSAVGKRLATALATASLAGVLDLAGSGSAHAASAGVPILPGHGMHSTQLSRSFSS